MTIDPFKGLTKEQKTKVLKRRARQLKKEGYRFAISSTLTIHKLDCRSMITRRYPNKMRCFKSLDDIYSNYLNYYVNKCWHCFPEESEPIKQLMADIQKIERKANGH